MIRSLIRTVPALLLAITMAGCEGNGEEATSQPAVALGAINGTCPIMGGDIDPNADTASYNGATVGFCCNNCVNKWNTWSDTQKSDFVAKQ